MIIPSIDIIRGKAVQLQQGKTKVLERSDIFSLVEDFKKYGEIAVVDLDAAMDKGNNLKLIKKICKLAECRVGGGIRNLEKANELLAAGAKKIIIGTKATKEFLKELPKDRIIVAIDTKGGKIVDHGWTNLTTKTPSQVIEELSEYCSEFLFTNVDKEGLMNGLDFNIFKKFLNLTSNKFTIAGGITTYKDIKNLEKLNVNSQIGMALYTGKIKLSEAFISVLDFKKVKGLIPTIVQDTKGGVLMLAYSSHESLKKTFATNFATYYSRSRKDLWQKGETSGNKQFLLKARYDCDKDAIIFVVKQKGCACHTGSYSCFGDKYFSLEDVYNIICDRIKNPKADSFVSNLAKNEIKIKGKILEEIDEMINYKDRDNLIWEVADSVFFIMMFMAKHHITIRDIENELWRRRK
ncbi:MAG: phosphoribosyl-AMP cyclohydrolase [Patescibacteria group bacterium]|nr:phosphoribosyl-AMP cyclohydrolase [Patescibacteria group bacterium]MDD5164719.1 phosphoribosyl-AMP cyclohydrolase [Patescibacteria group bacterium]MDD5534195.1 phosphoribosyl-AMP cyclohydrolase [Patescibacteria group bacterium]